jgi:hypothetical protein
MKLQLNKKKLKNLSKDAQILPGDMTPNVGGGTGSASVGNTCGTWQDGGDGMSIGCPIGNPILTQGVDCNASGSCGCNSQYDCTNTNTCK